MPRRKNNLLTDIMEITAKMPWWVGVTLAIVSYLVLSRYSTQDMISTTVNGKPDVASIITGSFLSNCSSWSVYIANGFYNRFSNFCNSTTQAIKIAKKCV